MSAIPRRLLVGVGNAGVSVLDRIAVEHPALKGLLVINNDTDSLTSSVIAERITFPENSGGDFTDGFLAIEEKFAMAIQGAASVILCGGLGGEIGSFLIPALAARAKADGITTLASVGIPFSFEGRPKRELAATALGKLHNLCDGVAVLDNDRLSGGVPSSAAIGAAFAAADQVLQSSLLALQGMLSTYGPVKITRNDLASVLRTPASMTHFGYGRAQGANRLHEALETALKSPLLTIAGKGSALKEVSALLLLLSGPSDLSFAEVQRAVSEIERVAGERCQVKVGVRAEGEADAPLEIFLLASSGGQSRSAVASMKNPEVPQSSPSAVPTTRSPEIKSETLSENTPPSVRGGKENRAIKPTKQGALPQTQGVLDLETYQRGRFDKSEPTIVAGEDLDIPTFLRKGIKLGTPSRH